MNQIVNFSPCQLDLIKTFLDEAETALIEKMSIIFSITLVKWLIFLKHSKVEFGWDIPYFDRNICLFHYQILL